MSGEATDPYRLERFVAAQDGGGTYQRAVAELRAGTKVSHWMWFVFPQIAGLGRSETARHYAIGSAGEARAFLAHPVLGPRLRECARIVADTEGRSAARIFGAVDAMKLRSSMTLFAAVAENPGDSAFRAVLAKYFDGVADEATLSRLLARDAGATAPSSRRPRCRDPASSPGGPAGREVRLNTMDSGEAQARRLGVGEFAFPGPLRDQLVAAILAGTKTTTTGLLDDYARDGEPLPRPGDLEVVIDSAGKPVALTETVAVRVLRLADVDLAHALGEGEGYASVAGWRAGHEAFWHSAEMRGYVGDPAFTVNDDTPVVAMEFRVVPRGEGELAALLSAARGQAEAR